MPPDRTSDRAGARALRLLLAAVLGVGAAVLVVACGSSGKGLIPSESAGPLEADFQAVAQAAQEGDGSCGATESAIRKTEHDLQSLPASLDSGLRSRLDEGVVNLAERARKLCAQPLSQSTTTTSTTSTEKTTPAKTTPTTTTPTTTSSTTETPPTATTETSSTAPSATTPAPTATTPPGGGTGDEGQNEEDPAGKGPAGTGPPGHAEGGQGGGTGVGQ